MAPDDDGARRWARTAMAVLLAVALVLSAFPATAHRVGNRQDPLLSDADEDDEVADTDHEARAVADTHLPMLAPRQKQSQSNEQSSETEQTMVLEMEGAYGGQSQSDASEDDQRNHVGSAESSAPVGGSADKASSSQGSIVEQTLDGQQQSQTQAQSGQSNQQGQQQGQQQNQQQNQQRSQQQGQQGQQASSTANCTPVTRLIFYYEPKCPYSQALVINKVEDGNTKTVYEKVLETLRPLPPPTVVTAPPAPAPGAPPVSAPAPAPVNPPVPADSPSVIQMVDCTTMICPLEIRSVPQIVVFDAHGQRHVLNERKAADIVAKVKQLLAAKAPSGQGQPPAQSS